MQFKVGDVVIHPSHGLGHIIGLEEKRLLGKEARLYYEVTIQQSTVWVLVEVHEVPALRPLTARGDLARYRSLLRSLPAPLNQDHRKRRLELTERLKQGSFQVVCEVVRDLTARGWRKPLGETDSTSLRRAREKLCQEWAASDGVSIAEATQEVESLLLESRQAYMA